jgi:hypothetical protein
LLPRPDPNTWTGWAINSTLSIGLLGSLAYGWLIVAWAVIIRARRAGRAREALGRGLVMALGFVGSLFGSFWAITSTWHSYFFDTRIARLLLVAAGLTLVAGCASPETVGDIRRRDLFEALLTAWVIGLALAWRWWSRSRIKPPLERTRDDMLARDSEREPR